MGLKSGIKQVIPLENYELLPTIQELKLFAWTPVKKVFYLIP